MYNSQTCMIFLILELLNITLLSDPILRAAIARRRQQCLSGQSTHNLVAKRLCFLRSAFVSTSECAIDAEKFNAAGNNMGGADVSRLEFGASQL